MTNPLMLGREIRVNSERLEDNSWGRDPARFPKGTTWLSKILLEQSDFHQKTIIPPFQIISY